MYDKVSINLDVPLLITFFSVDYRQYPISPLQQSTTEPTIKRSLEQWFHLLTKNNTAYV